jgi:hypothetical protein
MSAVPPGRPPTVHINPVGEPRIPADCPCVRPQPARPGRQLQVPAVVIQIGEGELQTFVPANVPPPDRMPHSEQQHRRLFALATDLGLTREERLEIAEQLLGRDVQTFKHFTAYDASRVIDALAGAALCREVMDQRPAAGPRQGL